MRRWAIAPSGSRLGTTGGSPVHHTTMGASGSRSGMTSVSIASAGSPVGWRRTTSLRPASPPTRIWASILAGPFPSPATTAMIRHGCSREAPLAALMPRSAPARSSATMMRVRTRVKAVAPLALRRAESWALTAEAVVARIVVIMLVSLRHPPATTVAGQHLVGTGRAPGPGPVGLGRALGLPEGGHRVEDPPGQLHLPLVGEEGRVAEQDVEDEPLVGLGGVLGEGVAVAEVHGHVPYLHRGARDLGAEADRHPLVGLDAEDKRVLAEQAGVAEVEGQVGGTLEHDGDLGDPAPEALAGAQVEGHPGPAAGLHLQPERGVGLGGGVRRDAVLLVVAAHVLPALPAGAVLAPGRARGEVVPEPDGREHLLLLPAQGDCVEGEGLLHRGEREQLEEVVLDDVPCGADPVVVAGAAADADVLGHGDLHVVDVVVVPHRLEELVGEAHRQDVLDRLLAQVVVDPEDRVLGEDLGDDGVELARGLEVVAEGLLDDHPPPRLAGGLGQAGEIGRAHV